MCGIFGYLDNSTKELSNVEILKLMGDSLLHRGPDSYGYWTKGLGKVNLGHRRLSIIDLSEYGSQPMESHSKRYVMVFNGEIYNYEDIRKELITNRNITFKGHSDTEVILVGIDTWGITKTLQKLKGMFAIAVYDTKEEKLYLIRDRIGEKPLYFGWSNKDFIFASELKAIKKHPLFNNKVNREALKLYFKYNYIPSPYSIYENINKLNPGSILEFDLKTNKYKIKEYWKLEKNQGLNYEKIEDKEIINNLEKLLINSIEKQMLAADVPIGAFLSGGVDSSTIVALMQKISNNPINTFSIGFNEDGYNEAQYAKKVADYLKTNHTELYLSSKEAHEIVPDLPNYYDEPFADSSQIPTFLVSKLAKKYVTVTLSGDGGDELFGGYERYKVMDNFVDKSSYIPSIIKHNGSKLIKKLEESSFSKYANTINPKLSDHLYRAGELLRLNNPIDVYNYFLSSWKEADNVVLDNQVNNNFFINSQESISFLDENSFIEWMMYVDTKMYLPDDILVKVDRASMANSLESRVPLLDHEIVEFAHNLPLHYKIRGKTQKWILKQVMYRYLPAELMNRPKKGFGVPIDQWLRGPLKDWAEELLDENLLIQQGYLNSKLIRSRWEQHKSGTRNWQSHLWSVLMFQSWLKNN